MFFLLEEFHIGKMLFTFPLIPKTDFWIKFSINIHWRSQGKGGPWPHLTDSPPEVATSSSCFGWKEAPPHLLAAASGQPSVSPFSSILPNNCGLVAQKTLEVTICKTGIQHMRL